MSPRMWNWYDSFYSGFVAGLFVGAGLTLAVIAIFAELIK